ncbi:hypothetical protein [Paenarthrobacter nitroguajacolicus]|nr:hypothetical protein [Paenarthrobacter nitroguajacolicus]
MKRSALRIAIGRANATTSWVASDLTVVLPEATAGQPVAGPGLT